MTSECDHKFVYFETKKIKGSRPVFGFDVDWIRIDIFICEKCLKKKVIKQTASVIEYENREPDWW
jgi:hypothetical protein